MISTSLFPVEENGDHGLAVSSSEAFPLLDSTRITEPLVAVSVVPPSTPSEVEDMTYTPALLLPCALNARITDHARYQQGCAAGFDCYVEDLLEWDETERDRLMIPGFYTLTEVQNFVVDNLVVVSERFRTPLAWRAGFVMGWLSTLALVDRPLALDGLSLLVALVTRLQQVTHG